MKKLNYILLVDDSPADNHFHKKIIEKMNIAENIAIVEDGFQALDYINDKKNTIPDLIFLDINMPKMNGWEFLEEFKSLDPAIKAKTVIVVLSTSANMVDIKRAENIDAVSDFETKPLDRESIENILYKFF